MDLDDIEVLCWDKLDETGAAAKGYGFTGWTNEVNTFGRTYFVTKEIKLSRVLLPLQSDALILDTILHECAHAVVDAPGHGQEWQAVARKLGARPTAMQHADTAVPPKYHLVCSECGWDWPRFRRTNIVGRYHCKPGAELLWYEA